MTKAPEPNELTPLERLRAPFPAHQISKLPKESKAQIDERKANRSFGVNCKICGGWHHKNAVHLDYVGHAALTDRLLDCDPQWSWEPVSFDANGLPARDATGGLWIRLTVAGVTRLGYGHADGKSGGDAVKEAIGDALRNAAMRFGAALDLWHKGDLHLPDGDNDAEATTHEVSGNITAEQVKALQADLVSVGADAQAFLKLFRIERVEDMAAADLPRARAMIEAKRKKAEAATPFDEAA